MNMMSERWMEPLSGSSHIPAKPGALAPRTPAREFTVSDRALIAKLHNVIEPGRLLSLLNDRLCFDLGPGAAPYLMEQLRVEIDRLAAAKASGGLSWTNMRKLLSQAEEDGVLQQIDEQVIKDFAVIFSLNERQLMKLKDILLPIDDEGDE